MKGKKYRFAEFELSPADGQLRNGASEMRLQEKPLLLLTTLLDHPQSLVSRDQLRNRMWDSETYVDYEQGINVAVRKVRDALGDSAEHPRFIRTIARKGYEWLAPVEVIACDAESIVTPAGVAAPIVSARKPNGAMFAKISAALAAFGVVIGITLGARFLHRRGGWQARPIGSIAILPLRNLSPDPGQDYFADGITEDLITELARSLPLRVISRTSVMRYKQTGEPITQIARELGVEAIVEGAVTRSGDRVAVTVQLIDARQDRHMWAQRYDRKLTDLLTMESDLSREIAGQVSNTLATGHRVELAPREKVDPNVYELCLLGRYFWNKRTPVGLAKSIEYFQEAIQRNPNYGPAYAGLANSYVILPSYDSVGWEDSFAKARIAATRAIELDDTLPEAHAALGMIAEMHWMVDRNTAEHEFRRALELNPNYSTAHHWFSFYLICAGRMDEAVQEMERARQLDPLSAIINADEGHLLYAAGQDEQARARLRQAIALAPDLGQPHSTLALIDLEDGQSADALKEARIGLGLDYRNPRTIAETGYVLAQTGHAAEARKMLAILNQLERRGTTSPVFSPFIYLGLGERDRAVDLLAELERRRIGGGVRGFRLWPIFDQQLKNDSRYQKLLTAARQ